MKGDTKYLREAEGFARSIDRAGLSSLEALSSRSLGEAVTDRRSSWVRRFTIGSRDVFIKTYDYPHLRDLIRGLFRTTFGARSRARREWDALSWMRAHGFAAPEPLLVLEHRWHGVLRRAVLVTASYPGEPLDRLLTALDPADRDSLLVAVENLVERLHRAGFRDRNLDLRNLLARPLPDDDQRSDWEVVKIDSPRHHLTRPGPAHDRSARRDWDRLARSLERSLA